MDLSQIVVTIGGAGLIIAVLVFFFGPRERTAAGSDASGVQEIEVLVKGGYNPDVITAKRGRPLRLQFNRQETDSCSEVVVFPDLGIRRELPAFRRTSIEFVPEALGEYTFTCGMSMLRGKLVVTE